MEINRTILSLGSNIEPREDFLKNAFNLLNKKAGRIIKTSKIYTTPPLGFESEQLFLNCCFLMETILTPNELLQVTQSIEIELGRSKKSINNEYASRTIDIDIIFYNQDCINTENLIIPHPLYSKRKFVLKPLNDLAESITDPISYLTVEQLLINCEDNSSLVIYENQFFDTF